MNVNRAAELKPLPGVGCSEWLGSPSNLVFVLFDITSEEWSQSFRDERLHNQTEETCESSSNQTANKNPVAFAHGCRYPTSEKDAEENDEPYDAEMPRPKRRSLLAEHRESPAPHNPAVGSSERRQLRNLSVCEVEPHSCLTTQAQPRRASGGDPRSGTDAAPRRWLQRMVRRRLYG